MVLVKAHVFWSLYHDNGLIELPPEIEDKLQQGQKIKVFILTDDGEKEPAYYPCKKKV